MQVIWTSEALQEIEAIIDYIALDNPSAGETLALRIFSLVESILPDNPNIGRRGRSVNTRELVVHSSYLIAYRVRETNIEILSVRHTARLWPENF